MGIEFQCDECGQLLNVDTEPGMTVTCPHCSADVVVPAALASLPKPQVEGVSPPPSAPPRQDTDEEYLDEDELAEEASGVMTVMAHAMPWTISVFFHAGLALIFFLLVLIAQAEPKKIPTIPSTTHNLSNPGGSISQGNTSKVNKNTQRHRKVKASGDSTRDLEVPVEGDKGDAADLIGLAAGGGGGTLADYGITDGGSGSGPGSSFGGLGGNAHHVVYLIDRSGSMFDVFEAVKNEIVESVRKLDPKQDFHVIMFAEGDPLEKQPMALTPPTEKYILALAKFLETVKAERTTNPIKAINRAFDVLAKANRRPGKIIYMLTDGAFPDNDAVIEAIASRNRRKSVLINTFLYGWKPPIAEKVMIKIAAENGGKYRYVSPDE
jgi:hypothetical protein